MNINGFSQMFQSMIRQGGQNPAAFVQNYLQQNPQFAQQIQGKNVQQEAAQAMKRMGVSDQQIRQMFPGAKI